MTPDETALVLAKAALIDMRTIGEEDVMAWYEIVQRLDFRDALTAVARHYGETRDRLMPADLIRHAKAVDHDRRRDARERAEAEQAIEATEARRAFTAGEVSRAAALIAALIAELRGKLPAGDPAKLRGTHWLATHAVGQLRDDTRPGRRPAADVVHEPNPYYDPNAARQLAEMNAADLPAAPGDAPAPEPESTP
jgi:hypothetical protein